ncbi:MAG: DUF2270 domain-containing protein [Dehalococcoidia bacterium]
MAMSRDPQGISAPQSLPHSSSADFNTAMVHLYRAQTAKADTWRNRLDATTNWSVVTTAAAISFALGDKDAQRHVVILLVSVLVTFFLVIEARRYQHYDIWQTRVQLMDADFFAPLLWPEGQPPHPEWRQLLAVDLVNPAYHISFSEAVGWRLRRNYVWIYVMLLTTWLVKVIIHPTPITSVSEFFQRASLGPIHGGIMLFLGVLFNGSLIAIAFLTEGMHSASGEIMTRREMHEKIQQVASVPKDANG